MNQIAMRAMELDGIKTDDSGSGDCIREGPFHVMDFFLGQDFGDSSSAQSRSLGLIAAGHDSLFEILRSVGRNSGRGSWGFA